MNSILDTFIELYKENNDVITIWEKSGMLVGVRDDKKKEDLALSYETIYEYLVTKKPLNKHDEFWATLLFPIARRVYEKGNLNTIVEASFLVEILKKITLNDIFSIHFKYIQSRDDIMQACEDNNFLNIPIFDLEFDKLYEVLKDNYFFYIDFEAEMTAGICDYILGNYFNKSV